MKLIRTSLLNALESVAPGLASREMVDQGTCAVFMGGFVCTYNDQIFCKYKLEDGLAIEGAVPMAPLRSILHKLSEDEIDVTIVEGMLMIRGKGGRETGIRIDPKIELPIDKVEVPEKFKKLPASFTTAINRVVSCASNDSGMYNITCVQMSPDHIEATDNSQMIRYQMKMPLTESVLVRATSLAAIRLSMPKSIAFTRSWVHFKNSLGLRISIRKDAGGEQEFPKLDQFIKFTGKSIVLPKSIAEACERAAVFSSEDAESNMVKVTIAEGKKMLMRGEGSTGFHTEPKKIDYKGPPLEFIIHPELLAALVKEGHPCKVQERRLIMDGGDFTYAVALEKPVDPSEITVEDESDDE